ncbi:MAG: hypothetical protein QOJ19_482 [Acidimicrobiia bacterium]|jgi:hypothetical protein|nr:hypothetical protein [Acidimicrobiia bacterium]
MSTEETWHATPDVLAAYAAGSLGRTSAASVDAHLLVCASCRAAIVPLAPRDRLARNLAMIHTRIDAPTVSWAERLLRRASIPERITRMLFVTPSARAAWLVAIVGAMAAAILAGDLSHGSERAMFAFLVGAPLVPLGVVSTTFATHSDPARELVVASPTPAFELLLVRAVAVLGPATILTLVASLVVPGHDGDTVLWLLPSLGLAAATLALGSWLPVRAVSWVLGGAWVMGALVSARGAAHGEVIERYAAFRPTGQAALVVVTALAGFVVVLRRDAFDLVDSRRPS